MSEDKGKQPAGAAGFPAPRPPPQAGSANPSASLASLWSYLEPALDHIVRSSTNTPEKAPAIDVEYHMGIHTAIYNYFTAQSDSGLNQARSNAMASGGLGKAVDRGDHDKAAASGADIYEKLDVYFAETAQELLFNAPQDDDVTLVQYLVPCFRRYSAGAQSVNRLLNYVNRHYVKRVVGEDRGWLRLADVMDAVLKSMREEGLDTREKVTKRLRDKRLEELKKWGYEDGASVELAAQAEACAEAASTLDRVVPISSVAYRRFRTEVLEPLLAVPKDKGKGKGVPQPGPGKRGKPKSVPPASLHKPPGPKGRLARAGKDLIEWKAGNAEEKKQLAAGLADAMKSCGIRPDQPLRKRMEKFAASVRTERA